MTPIPNLEYDPESDTYTDPATGRRHIKCDARSGRPSFLDISRDQWETWVMGVRCNLDWGELERRLPALFVLQAREATLHLLRQHDPKYLNQLRLALTRLAAVLRPSVVDWTDLTMGDWNHMVGALRRADLSTVRVMYRQVTVNLADETMARRLVQLEAYRLQSRKQDALRDVATWQHDRGAFVDEELETLVRFLRPPAEESAVDQAARLIALIALHLGKRSSQILLISDDGLVTREAGGRPRSYLRVPKVKRQRGEDAELWAIPETLAADLQRFSARPEVRALQQHSGRLLIWESKVLSSGRDLHTGVVSKSISRFFGKARLTTQRDKALPPRPLIFTTRRARHTVGTHLAFKGASSAHISRVLEHDTPASAQTYIDAVTGLMHAAIDEADRKLGGVFSSLSDTYFAGQVGDTLTDQPILVPSAHLQPLPVGSCTATDTCRKHPFFSCYNGCPSFLAWRSADHHQALAYVEEELAQWTARESHPSRSAFVLEFERLYQAILSVIKRIETHNGGGHGP